MNRFGANERNAPPPTERGDMDLLTKAFLFFWDKGQRVPADLAALLIEEGHDVEALEHQYT